MQKTNDTINYFELLGVPQSMEVDVITLTQNYFKLQQQYHPDKNPPDVAKSALVNQAFNKVKNRFTRLEYLLELNGQSDLKASPEVLMEIMELRENPPEDAIKKAKEDIERLLEKASLNFTEKNYERMAENYVRLKYLKKFIEDANASANP